MKRFRPNICLLIMLLLTQTSIYSQNSKPKKVTNVKAKIIQPSQKNSTSYNNTLTAKENKEPVDTFTVNGKYGLKAKTGRIVLEPKCDNIFQRKNSTFFIVQQSGKYGIFNYAGKQIVPVEYENLRDETWTEKAAQFPTSKDGKWGAYDTLGKHILPEIYESVYPSAFNNGISLKNNGKWAYADSTGRLLTDFSYDDIGPKISKSQTHIAVASNGKWGFLGMDYKLAIDYKYDKVFSPFYHGIAEVSLNGIRGYIDYEGNFNTKKDNLGKLISTKTIDEDIEEIVQEIKNGLERYRLLAEGETMQEITYSHSGKNEFATLNNSTYTIIVISKDVEHIGLRSSELSVLPSTINSSKGYTTSEDVRFSKKGNLKLASIVLGGTVQQPLGIISFVPVGKTSHKVKYLVFESSR